MKTTIEFKGGQSETMEDAMPNCYMDSVSLLDADCNNLTDDIPLDLIERIVFEND